MECLGRLLNNVVLGQRFLSAAQALHQGRGTAFKPVLAFVCLGDDAVVQPCPAQRVKQPGGGGGAQAFGIDRCRGQMGNAGPHACAGVVQDDLVGVRHIGELAFNDCPETAKLEQHIGPVLAVNVDGLGVSAHAEL